MYVCIYVLYVCMYVYMYLRMYVCMYVGEYRHLYLVRQSVRRRGGFLSGRANHQQEELARYWYF